MKKNSLCVAGCQGQKNIKTKSQQNIDESWPKVNKTSMSHDQRSKEHRWVILKGQKNINTKSQQNLDESCSKVNKTSMSHDQRSKEHWWVILKGQKNIVRFGLKGQKNIVWFGAKGQKSISVFRPRSSICSQFFWKNFWFDFFRKKGLFYEKNDFV